jgi:hypothetical protein
MEALSMHHLHFNHLALLVSAVMQWLLGAIWYSPVLFARPWSAMVGVTRETARKNAMIAGMIVSFIGSLVVSFILAHIIFWSGVDSFVWGALIGFIAWAGFMAAPLSASYIYEGRPFTLFAINTGYWLLALILSGGLLAVWR